MHVTKIARFDWSAVLERFWYQKLVGLPNRAAFYSLASTPPGRRGCRGHIASNILVGGTSMGISPPILLRIRSDIADQH